MSATDIGCDHIDPIVPQFIADLRSGITIKASIYLVAATAIDRRSVLGDLLIALTSVSRSQFMRAFEVMCVQDLPVPGAPLVAANSCSFRPAQSGYGYPLAKHASQSQERIANVLIHSNPVQRLSTGTVAFGAVLDVDLAEVFGLPA